MAIAAVHEDVFLPRVPMKITIQINLATFQCLPYHLFNSVAFWEKFRTWIYVLTIEVVARKTTTIVSYNDSIRVEHRYHFEYITITQQLSHIIVTDKKSDDTLHHE